MDYFQDNRLLRVLSPSDQKLLHPAFSTIELDRGHVLQTIGASTGQAFFIETGLAAVVARSPGREIGIGVVGNDGMTGLDLVLEAGLAANQTLVQSAGRAVSILAADLQEAMKRSATLHALLLRYAHVFMVQASQTALTNGHASIEERLARWVLMSHDRFSGNDLTVTHEFISLMVGVRRQGITEALHLLEGRHLIQSTRENLHVIDRPGLIALASGSYGVCEAEYERLIDGQFRRALLPA
ncbi:MAG: cyclic nucleotide-binding protein [Reyranella sp.]|nr:cyclic nucleotide-binding protein [Reyranella sp.]